jgi:tRNA (guanosine-2'-O-)-methyltransferase
MEHKISTEKLKLIDYLSQFLTEERKIKMEKILPHRSNYICSVMENIFQAQNASAVIRSAECLGIQNIHIIENTYKYKINPDVVLGSNKWLNIHHYKEEENNTETCIAGLKEQGYRIIATSPHKNDCLLDELPIDGKMALLFGTEKEGLSDIALDLADEYVRIPMVGFTESYNISVSAAICMFHLTSKVKKSDISWQLSETELIDLKLEWYKRSIKSIDKHLEHYLELNKKD